MLFPPSFGSFLFPLLATMHAGEGAGDTDNTGIHAKDDKVEVPSGTDGGMLGESELRQGLPRRAVRSPDERLALVTGSYGKAMCELAGTPDPEGHALLQEALVGFELGRDGRRSRVPEANGGMNAGELGGGESGGDRERLDADGSRGRGAGAEGGAEGAAESDLAALMQRTRCGLWWAVVGCGLSCAGLVGCRCALVLLCDVLVFLCFGERCHVAGPRGCVCVHVIVSLRAHRAFHRNGYRNIRRLCIIVMRMCRSSFRVVLAIPRWDISS